MQGRPSQPHAFEVRSIPPCPCWSGGGTSTYTKPSLYSSSNPGEVPWSCRSVALHESQGVTVQPSPAEAERHLRSVELTAFRSVPSLPVNAMVLRALCVGCHRDRSFAGSILSIPLQAIKFGKTVAVRRLARGGSAAVGSYRKADQGACNAVLAYACYRSGVIAIAVGWGMRVAIPAGARFRRRIVQLPFALTSLSLRSLSPRFRVST